METKEILNERLQNDFRAEQMKIVIKNRLRLLKSDLLSPPIVEGEKLNRKSQIKAYEDCINILNKEFFELQLPYDINLETKLHDVKETIVNKIYPIDDRIRGSKEYRGKYIENHRRAGEIADIIESLCYEMFNQGYECANKQNEKTKQSKLMVYQIYYGNVRKNVMFDIEYYQRQSEHEDTKGLWCSEIHVLPCVEGITRFLESKKGDDDFNYDMFIEDATEIQELRGWLYGVDGNKYCEYDVNNKFHYHTRREYIETVINDFINLYDLSLNVD